MGLECVAQFGGGKVQCLLRLHGDLAPPAAVIAVADQTLAGFSLDGVNRMSRDPTAGSNVNGDHFHVPKSMCRLDPGFRLRCSGFRRAGTPWWCG